MKKGFIYALIAAILGLTLVLIPLVTIRVESEHDGVFLSATTQRLQSLEGGSYNTNAASSWSNELSFLAISFALALTAFLIVRRRVPQQGTA
ncbi:hypothetical protein HXY33_08390 [Candidatus Bathyarchaeota archaeon]|nr:hypothetical protein [Candidatus Bathyarchaeota archaeon]